MYPLLPLSVYEEFPAVIPSRITLLMLSHFHLLQFHLPQQIHHLYILYHYQPSESLNIKSLSNQIKFVVISGISEYRYTRKPIHVHIRDYAYEITLPTPVDTYSALFESSFFNLFFKSK